MIFPVLVLLLPWLGLGIACCIYEWVDRRERRSLQREAVDRFDAAFLSPRTKRDLAAPADEVLADIAYVEAPDHEPYEDALTWSAAPADDQEAGNESG
jgi:hypothetical protein